MKLESRLCFLVLAISSISRGHDESTPPPHVGDPEGYRDNVTVSRPPWSLNETGNDATGLNSSTPSPASVNTTFTPGEQTQSTDEDDLLTKRRNENTTAEATTAVSVAENGTKGADDVVMTKSTAIIATSSKPVMIEEADNSSWGYVILVMIILVIVVLCAILYLLRRVYRTYSFDLQRPGPVSHLNEPIGTFEPVYLDDLERPVPEDNTTADDLSLPPVANGTTQSEEKCSSAENALREQPEANGVDTSPTSNTSPSSGDDPGDEIPDQLSSTNFFFDSIGEQQNENNNNNPSVCSTDPFVEINLEEPAWSDQLLASPEAPSLVLPFSPFSFSSS